MKLTNNFIRFVICLSFVLGASHPKSWAASSDERYVMSGFTKTTLNRYYEEAYSDGDLSNKIDQERTFPVHWYTNFDPTQDAADLDMQDTYERTKEFHKEHFMQGRGDYNVLVNEVFFRFVSLLRLGQNGYSQAYLLEFEQILRRLSDLDIVLDSYNLGWRGSRHYAVSAITEAAINEAMASQVRRGVKYKTSAREVFSTLIDVTTQKPLVNEIRRKYDEDRFLRRFVKILGTIAVYLASVFAIDQFDLGHYVSFFPGPVAPVLITVCSAAAIHYGTNLIDKPKFHCKQKFIFKEMAGSCGKALERIDSKSSNGIGAL